MNLIPCDLRQTSVKKPRIASVQLLIALMFFIAGSKPCSAYSVLTHEQLIDLAWKNSIRPLLLSRFPASTQAQLEEAHAYAFGGCAIQDMGYYPFGKGFFSDLTHYVRTGDFIVALFRNAHNVDEYAFAIGALSHYLGDSIGHADAINPSTAIEFPKLEKKYGPLVTYDEDPHAHVRTEFAFDVDMLAHHHLAPAAYFRHVGFMVPRRLLQVAFLETYGLQLHEILGTERPAIRSYRTSVRNFIPRFAHAEVVLHRSQFPPDASDDAFRQYNELLTHADFMKTWNGYRRGPGFLTHLLAVFIVIVPKIGAASDLAIRGPNEDTKAEFVRSVVHTMSRYRELLGELPITAQSSFDLPNLDLDTGDRVKPGAYRLTDQTYFNLLRKITADPARLVPPTLRQNLLDYYADPTAPIFTKRNKKDWQKVQAELAILQQMKVAPAEPRFEPMAPAGN